MTRRICGSPEDMARCVSLWGYGGAGGGCRDGRVYIYGNRVEAQMDRWLVKVLAKIAFAQGYLGRSNMVSGKNSQK